MSGKDREDTINKYSIFSLENLINVIWVTSCGIFATIYIVTAAPHLGSTFDEPLYVEEEVGISTGKSMGNLLHVGTMPLPMHIQSTALKIHRLFTGKQLNIETNYEEILRISRLGNLPFLWLLLIFSFRLAKNFGNSWSGRLTVFLLATEPNLLAHSMLATAEIAISSCFILFVFYYIRGRDGSYCQRVLIPTVLFALLLSAKASGLVFGILTMIAVECHRLIWHEAISFQHPIRVKEMIQQIWRASHRFRRETMTIVFLGTVLMCIYCGSDWKAEASFVKWAVALPESSFRTAILWFAEHFRLFPNGLEGIAYQIKHNLKGNGAYLFETWYTKPIWFYFPVAISLKLTIPILFLSLCLVIRSSKILLSPLGIIFVLLFLNSVTYRVQIGIRMILPIICLWFIILGIGYTFIVQSSRYPRIWQGILTVSLGTILWPVLTIWPNPLTFFNLFGGGSENGYLCLSDSNYDWGQGLKELTNWCEEHRDHSTQVWYFGRDPMYGRHPSYTPAILHQFPIKNTADFYTQVHGDYLAVGTTILFGRPHLSPAADISLEEIRKRQPIARTSTFFIYDFTKEP